MRPRPPSGPVRAGRAALLVAALSAAATPARAAPSAESDAAPPPTDAPPIDAPPLDPPIDPPPPDAPIDAPPPDPPIDASPPDAPTPAPLDAPPPDASTDAAPPEPVPPAPKPKPKKKKKARPAAKPAEKRPVNQGTAYNLGVFPGSYVQGPGFSVGVAAGVRQRLEPKKNHTIALGLAYAYEPFSTRTLGFPEEDEVAGEIRRTLVQPIHVLEGSASRQIKWGKLVTTSLDLAVDAWWPEIRSQQRWSARLTPSLRIGRATGLFGQIEAELYYKKFPHYYIDSVMRRIDQEGGTPTGQIGYNVRKFARLAAGFAFDYTHYLDAHYNAVADDGTWVRSTASKNYLDFIPFADVVLRPVKGLRIRARYAFERQITRHYDRVMTGRDEFASLVPKFFAGYYDYRRHRANVWISWDFRDRLRVAAAAAAWIRHFDVYEARTADNYWTGELRLDTEVEASLELAVRVATVRSKRMRHDFFVSLLGSHVSRRSNMQRQISLATNFDITRAFLGFEVRGR